MRPMPWPPSNRCGRVPGLENSVPDANRVRTESGCSRLRRAAYERIKPTAFSQAEWCNEVDGRRPFCGKSLLTPLYFFLRVRSLVETGPEADDLLLVGFSGNNRAA